MEGPGWGGGGGDVLQCGRCPVLSRPPCFAEDSRTMWDKQLRNLTLRKKLEHPRMEMAVSGELRTKDGRQYLVPRVNTVCVSRLLLLLAAQQLIQRIA